MVRLLLTIPTIFVLLSSSKRTNLPSEVSNPNELVVIVAWAVLRCTVLWLRGDARIRIGARVLQAKVAATVNGGVAE
jgi:hypothetical protein